MVIPHLFSAVSVVVQQQKVQEFEEDTLSLRLYDYGSVLGKLKMNSSVSQLESEVVEITFRFARFVSRNIKLNYTIEQITILVEMNVIMS